MNDRYDRQIRFFGRAGQDRLEQAEIVLLGTGGNGIHVVQQLTYAGVHRWAFVEFDIVEDTNLNRLITATPADTGALKTDIAVRVVKTMHPNANPTVIHGEVGNPDIDDDIRTELASADLVIGCFDKEIPRQEAVKLCSAAGVPYLDVATEILGDGDELEYGGRVVFTFKGTGCAICLGVIDPAELAREQMNDAQRAERDRLYGLTPEEAGGSGPSVVTINGVVASLACTEALVYLTGLREPARQLTYLAHNSVVRKNTTVGDPTCLYCTRWREARANRTHPLKDNATSDTNPDATS
ncbi:MAG: ThiF family adenylyltransferase [Nocardioides sp.]|uniref:HesA/MoeB/ThiF family protein n=1 Tax=Nocardioides sp. TaxID=35761 RepID=UPI0023971947|nr:ThiF family adenylyltransferase [Nocardioides sp.]MDE0778929.1 ThiF family adenylyltransferase [Nocardioides sp.]